MASNLLAGEGAATANSPSNIPLYSGPFNATEN
jgi:hypothetical protein